MHIYVDKQQNILYLFMTKRERRLLQRGEKSSSHLDIMQSEVGCFCGEDSKRPHCSG